MRSIIDTDLKIQITMSIEVFSNGAIAVGVFLNNEHTTIVNHIGDLDLYLSGKKKTSDLDSIKKFKTLIDYCFKTLGNSKQIEPIPDFMKVN